MVPRLLNVYLPGALFLAIPVGTTRNLAGTGVLLTAYAASLALTLAVVRNVKEVGTITKGSGVAVSLLRGKAILRPGSQTRLAPQNVSALHDVSRDRPSDA